MCHGVPVGTCLGLATFVAVGLGNGQRKFGYRHVAFQHLPFGVFAGFADKGYFIEAARGKSKSSVMRAAR